MRLVLMGFIVILTIVMIFTGSRDAAQMKDDYDKYKGDKLVKAISEYNEKSSALKGHVGSAGVTRTPMQSGNAPVQMRRPGDPAPQMPPYMMSRPPSYYYPEEQGYNPYDPYLAQQKTARQHMAPSQPASRSDDGYYPPPPLQQQTPSQLQRPYRPGSNFIVPMNLPEQPWPKEMMQLRTGQEVAFAGTTVYTYDYEGNPVPLPDGEYYLGAGNYKMTVKNGKKVLSR